MYLKPVVLSVEHQGKLDSFDCGVPDLNLWLKKFASNNQVRGASRTYVSLNSEGFIAGFFCISNAVIDMSPYQPPNVGICQNLSLVAC